MKFLKISFGIVAVLLLWSACKKDELKEYCHSGALKVTILPTYNNEPLVLNDSLYDDYEGRKFRVEMFKFYLSHLMIENHEGELIELDTVSLVDFAESNYSIETYLEKDVYTKLHFAIGLDSIMNGSDPALFDSDHPLSISQNTHWSWASKYKFLMLEGRVDTSGLGDPGATFSYHTGFNSMYREVVLSLHDFELEETEKVLEINFALDELVNGSTGTVDFVDQSTAHSDLDIDVFQTLSDNLLNAFTLN